MWINFKSIEKLDELGDQHHFEYDLLINDGTFGMVIRVKDETKAAVVLEAADVDELYKRAIRWVCVRFGIANISPRLCHFME